VLKYFGNAFSTSQESHSLEPVHNESQNPSLLKCTYLYGQKEERILPAGLTVEVYFVNLSGYNAFCPGYNTHTGRFSRQNGLSRVLLIETPIFAYFENQVYHLVDRSQGNL
jgi:hypothetical protein